MLYYIILGADDAIKASFEEKVMHDRRFFPVRIADGDNNYATYFIIGFLISEGS